MIGAWLLVPLTWRDSVPKFLASNKLCVGLLRTHGPAGWFSDHPSA